MAKIELNDVHLTFTIRQQRRVPFKEFLLRGLFLQSRNPKMAVHALSGINLQCGIGERLGIIGHNGAGKSTLLKLLAGVYPPTSGTRNVEGRICSLFDISLGFELDSSGWENIKYRSYLLGETPRSLATKIDGIAEFTELGEYLNIPVRYYSSGMLVRLAFAISTAVNPEVLLVDEVLSVGDAAFQIKAQQRMRELMAAARLMVMVSHDLESIRNLCTQVLWLEHGTMRMLGPADEVVSAYLDSVRPRGGQEPEHTGVGGVATLDEDTPVPEAESAITEDETQTMRAA
jgi:lipopolysaccharide transport system ATP-binding protein